MSLSIHVLGGLRVVRDGISVERPQSQKAAALLAWLALRGPVAHSREELATMLWPDATASGGRHSLRTALYEVRKLLGRDILTDRETIALVPGSLTTDVAEFTAASGSGRLEDAVSTYTGELLPGFFEPWVLDERRRLAALHADVLARLLDALVARGATTEAIDIAHKLVACDPFDESAQLGLMRLYAGTGRANAALDQYRSYSALLESELGVAPPEEVEAFVRSLRREPSVRASTPHRSRLPAPLTEFVGREEELDRLTGLLVAGETRLVTIAGAGGIGKTRLATEFGRRARDTHGAALIYVELADTVDDSFVADAIAGAMGLGALAASDPLDAAAASMALQTKPILILDNAERVATTAASVAQILLDAVPALRMLVTSRRALAVPGEVEIRLGPLPVPTSWDEPADLVRNPSVAMYVDRVRAKRADFKLTDANVAAVARLCRRLEGIPLALELAAVRERVLPASQLVGMLEKRFEVLVGAQRDVPERHRTLSAAIDWSYHALDPDARRAFERLAIFRGGWSLDDAEAMCESTGTGESLERMCEVSLVEAFDRAERRRFRMLETIREFALDRVPPDDLAELRRRHAARFCELAEIAGERLNRTEQIEWLDRIDADFDNMRAALDASLRAGDALTAVRLFVALNRFWQARSRQREARRWYRAARKLEQPLPPVLHKCAERIEGELALAEGDIPASIESFNRALAIDDGGGDVLSTGYSLTGLGHIAARHGEFEEARELLVRALDVANASGSADLLSTVHNDLGVLEAKCGDYERAFEHFSGSLAACRTLADRQNTIVLLYNLGYLAIIVGQLDRAREFLEESLATSRELGHVSGAARSTAYLGLAALRSGAFEEAIALCADAVEQSLEIGDEHELVLPLEGMGCALAAGGHDERAALVLGHVAGLRESVEAEVLLEDASIVRNATAAVRSRLGDVAFDRLAAEGRSSPTEQVLKQF